MCHGLKLDLGTGCGISKWCSDARARCEKKKHKGVWIGQICQLWWQVPNVAQSKSHGNVHSAANNTKRSDNGRNLFVTRLPCMTKYDGRLQYHVGVIRIFKVIAAL